MLAATVGAFAGFGADVSRIIFSDLISSEIGFAINFLSIGNFRFGLTGLSNVVASNVRPDLAAADSNRSEIKAMPGATFKAFDQSLQVRRYLHDQ